MKKIKFLSPVVLSTAVLLAGCSTLKTTVIPGRGTESTIIATADTGSTALQGAIKKATGICAAKSKQLVVLKHRTVYQGAGKAIDEAAGLAQNLLSSAGNYVPGLNHDENYKRFYCLSVDNLDCGGLLSRS